MKFSKQNIMETKVKIITTEATPSNLGDPSMSDGIQTININMVCSTMPIKINDWFVDEFGVVHQYLEGEFPPNSSCIKIVASTNNTLRLPKISQTWINNVYIPSHHYITDIFLELEEDESVMDALVSEHAPELRGKKIKVNDDNEVVIAYPTECKSSAIAELLAEIRNKLSPFWNLSSMVKDAIHPESEIEKILLESAKTAEANKDFITRNLDEILNLGRCYYPDTASVSRVEVIDHSGKQGDKNYGRAYTNYNVKQLHLAYQDDGKTLKLFVR